MCIPLEANDNIGKRIFKNDKCVFLNLLKNDQQETKRCRQAQRVWMTAQPSTTTTSARRPRDAVTAERPAPVLFARMVKDGMSCSHHDLNPDKAKPPFSCKLILCVCVCVCSVTKKSTKKTVTLPKRSSIFATCQDVARSMARRHTFEPTCVGTLASGLSSAAGPSAASASHAPTSSSATRGRTQVKGGSRVTALVYSLRKIRNVSQNTSFVFMHDA